MIRRISLAMFLIACSGCSPRADVVTGVRSSTATLEAVHVQPPTGATVGLVDWVYVVAPGSRPKGEPVFIADKVDGSRWSGAVLTIAADRARVFKATLIVTVRSLKGASKATVKVVIAEPVT